MTLFVGGLLGGVLGLGAWMVATAVVDARRTPLLVRVLPYVRDLPHPSSLPALVPSPNAFTGVFGPPLSAGGRAVERVLGGAASVRRRLQRAGLEMDVAQFRVEQVIWGVVTFAILMLLLICVLTFGRGRTCPVSCPEP